MNAARARIVGAALCALASIAFAEGGAQSSEHRPRLSREGCSIAADMVLMARSMSEAAVARETAGKVMALAYVSYSDEGGAVDRLRDELTNFGYRSKEVPADLAATVARACMANQGSLDQLLGSRVRWRL